ncbi:MAG: arylsulfatase A-like enzyme/pimeloyl-ACP methyl ester carboxylesterase [Planctomycetaceae bacterium]|jgi:arylsulfatase A-like enzyme/pimeloyl-ACP methyl ester carboxylesterase
MRERYRPWRVAMVIMSTTCALLPCRRGLTDQHATTSVSSTGKRPNIVLIMADDLGFSDLGCYGGEIATPNLDSVAQNGLRFTRFYNTARCWPTRGALLTGYYAQQIRRDSLPGIPSGGGNRGRRPDWAVLAPELLKPAGYRSYHTGKWHIDGMPVENGFDHSYLLRDQGRFFNPNRHWKDDVALPPVEKGTDFYATTALADHAIEVLTEHAEQHADAPFFHYLAFAAPHFPLHALPEDIAVYKDTYTEGWDSIRLKRWQRMRKMGLLDAADAKELSRVERDLGPPYHFPNAFEILGNGEVNKPLPWNSLTDEQKQFQATKMAIHAAMIHRMDIEIGRVFDQIRKMGQWENTLVVFLSDNGASAEIMVRDDGHDPKLSPGSAGTYLCLGPGWSTTCNTPFRRHKTWTHEGGTSTPFLMSWPKGIAARGEFRRNVGHVIDVVPTVLELAGAKTLEEAPPAPGKSLVPAFAKDQSVKHESLWWFHDGHKAIRVGDWKAVAPNSEPWELYNVANDRDESTDLAISEGDRLNELVAEWDRQLAEFTELASRDLPPNIRKKVDVSNNRPPVMKTAQAAAKPKRRQVLLGGRSFLLNGRHAFLMSPKKAFEGAGGKPWIFYGPTLAPYPDQAESWMHQQFLDAGIAIAGIDVGEAYGSPHAFPHFEALYQEMVKQGFSKKPAMLGRSRGGLWVSSWAIAHPDRVSGIGGIYPVYDFTTYPGVNRAAAAYGLSAEELLAQQDKLNPIKRASTLAKAKIPVFIIHGTDDKVVPLAANSAALEEVYADNDASDLIHVIKSEGQGHSFWPGFFTCQELVDFLIEKSKQGSQ